MIIILLDTKIYDIYHEIESIQGTGTNVDNR